MTEESFTWAVGGGPVAGSIVGYSAEEQASSPRGPTQLDSATKIVRSGRAYWSLAVYPTAGEAGGSVRFALKSGRGPGEFEAEEDRAATEATRRARGKIRRYATANGLNRLGTLTYSGEGCFEPAVFRGHIGRFFRKVKNELGGESFPYVWVPEWHPGGHGLHAHFAVGRYVKRRSIERAWGRGFVHIKLLGNLPVGSGRFEEARRAGRYLGKYVAKDFDADRIGGLHRYDVARGYEPAVVQVEGRSVGRVLEQACEIMGGSPSELWLSGNEPSWLGPPAVWASWSG